MTARTPSTPSLRDAPIARRCAADHRFGRLVTAIAVGSVALARSPGARAEIDVRALAKTVRASATYHGAPDGGAAAQRRFSAIVEAPVPGSLAAAGLPAIGSKWSVVRGPLADLDALARAHADWQITWSPPLHLLLDRAATSVRAPAFRSDTGETGKGVFVGVVDTGADVTLPDFRNADGSTRIRYFVDFGANPGSFSGEDTEAESRCTAEGLSCAVYTEAGIDQLISQGTTDRLAPDMIGHGTHVASLAAGNGGLEKKYVGIAPEASLVVVRAIGNDGSIEDPTVFAGTDIVFWLADREASRAHVANQPAVVNLSLGSDFGPHDGSTALERGLADLVGPSFPGRAIVVAAGNSAATFSGAALGIPSAYKDPFGIHAEINVTDGTSVRVPIVGSGQRSATVAGSIAVWLSFRPGDDVSVGLDRLEGTWLDPVPPGSAVPTPEGQDPGATIVNGTRKILSELVSDQLADAPGITDDNAAAVLIGGSSLDSPVGHWASNEVFSIRLEGHGTASLWIQPGGDLDPETGSLFPRATAQATIGIPATAKELIAVGATVNRTNWVDSAGDTIDVDFLGAPDSLGFFSAGGPTTDLRIKPDLVAPGALVVGAMSGAANPMVSGVSIFGNGGGFCTQTNCAVVDDTHAIAAGTSMSSPIVAGAVALLLERDPTLTQHRILTLLQAGARHPEGSIPLDAQLGAGALDLEGVLDVENVEQNPVVRAPVAARSWITLGQSYGHPDPAWRIPAYLQVRDANGRIAAGFGSAAGNADAGTTGASDAAAFSVEVDNGSVTGAVERTAPGFFRFSVAPASGTGGSDLGVHVLYRGQPFLSKSVLIAVDVNVVREGFLARGGCAVSAARNRGRDGSSRFAAAAAALAVTAFRRRPSRSAARRVRSRDRTDSSGRGHRDSFQQ